MKQKLTLLAVLVCTTIISCKKDKNLQPDKEIPFKLLSKIIETKGAKVLTTSLTYDEKKRISSVKSEKEILSFTYENDDLVMVTRDYGELKLITKVTYSAHNPVSAIQNYVPDILGEPYLFEYHMDGGRVTSFDLGLTNNLRNYRMEFKDKNLIRFTNPAVYDNEFIYGTKKNIYYNSRLKNVVDLGLSLMASENDLIKIKIYNSGHLDEEITYTYTYDENGFPLTAKVQSKISNGTITDSNIKYEY